MIDNIKNCQLIVAIFLASMVLVACDKLPEQDSGEVADAIDDVRDGADADEVNPPVVDQMPTEWTIITAAEVPEAVDWTADDLARYLQDMGLTVVRETGESVPDCSPGTGVVALLGDGLGETPAWEVPALQRTRQLWRIDEERCEGGAVVRLAGFGLHGRQHAAYEYLHQLGVRFFHPEQEYVPSEPRWPLNPIVKEHKPPFRHNSVSLHLTHPLELGDPLREGDLEYQDEVRRYIDWNVKNHASFGLEGLEGTELEDYGVARGFPRNAGLNLYNAQQGGRPVIDPDDPRSVEEQLEEALENAMDEEDPVEVFSFSFNPSEFTEIEDTAAVEQLTFIANWFADNYPEVELYTTNHGTGAEPTETYGVRYYDLPRFAPSNLGVKVHTLMFYDLFRPAPVYNNENFRFLYDFMVEEYRDRALWHFPEAAWWLTFDIAVPLYLPITIEARDRDLQAIAFMLDGKLNGHRVFGSGHEWGYWQNEYCSLRMAHDLEYRWTDCVADLASPTGPAAAEVAEVLEDLVVLQERDIIYGDVLAYIVGTDPETEVAASVGIDFHPLPPAPRSMMRWDIDQIEDWKARIGPQLERMARDHDLLVARLNAVADGVPEAGLPWYNEIRDGIMANGLRAQHALEVYGAVVKAREAQLRFEPALADEAQQMLEEARATTAEAIEVIRRREEGYRYSPIERSIGGGPDGTEDDNWTIYGYRYLNRTHHGYYYTRIDELAASAIAGGDDVIEVPDTIVTDGESLTLTVVDSDLGTVDVDWGDGTSDSGADLSHDYSGNDVFTVDVTGEQEGQAVNVTFDVARVESEWIAGTSGTISEPEGTELIEPVMPGVTVARVDSERVVIGFSADDTGRVQPDRFQVLSASQGPFFEGTTDELRVPLINANTGDFVTSIVVVDAVVSLEENGDTISMTGALLTQAVIDAIVSIGGFDEEGARATVAATLGYTPDELPAEIPFVASYMLQ